MQNPDETQWLIRTSTQHNHRNLDIYAASLANVTLPVKILLDNAKIVLTVSCYNGSNCGVTLICVLPVSVCMSPVDPQKR